MVNIDEMTAGPAMDRLVAHALGWKRLSDRLWHDTDRHEHWLDGVIPCWSPSTDHNDAFELVENMDTLFRLARSSREVLATFTLREGKMVVDSYGIAETTPLAICRAYLKCLREKIMTSRSDTRARVACPACGRMIALSVFGYLWKHNNEDGEACYMSGRLLGMENVKLEKREDDEDEMV